VIGIIAILIAILLPALNRARAQSQVTKCAALVRQVAAASIMYANENKGHLPPIRNYSGDTFAFTNAGYIQNQDWPNSKECGSNIGRLVARKYLGGLSPSPNSGNAPASPYYECPNAIPDLADKDRYKFMYNFHMKAVNASGDLYRMWPKLAKYGRSPSGATPLYSLASGGQTTGVYPNIPRAIVTDPVCGTSGQRAYVTHNLRKSLAFNLGFADGSVRTVNVRPDTPMPASGDHKAIIATIQYLEAVDARANPTDGYDFTTYGSIPLMP
jgi:type II secretory pathway pseudopilin PulG